MYLGNIVGLLVVLTTVPFWAAILRIPFSVIAPVIIVICAIGAYTVHSSMFDVWLMLVFGVLGYLFKKLKYPLAPLVLALVLGDMAEASFRQAMLLSQGDLAIFWSNGLVGHVLLALLLAAPVGQGQGFACAVQAGGTPQSRWCGRSAVAGSGWPRRQDVTSLRATQSLINAAASIIGERQRGARAPRCGGAAHSRGRTTGCRAVDLKAHQVRDVLPACAIFDTDWS
jgi:hypothetical protein